MKSVIAKAVNVKEYKDSKPSFLLEMMFDDLVLLLKFMHQAQKEGLLKGPFFFTNQIDYLDVIWHHFILHTKLYHDFCSQEFGEYMHHEPTPISSVPSEEGQTQVADLLHEQMNLLENFLGREFVHRIFFVYPELLKEGP